MRKHVLVQAAAFDAERDGILWSVTFAGQYKH